MLVVINNPESKFHRCIGKVFGETFISPNTFYNINIQGEKNNEFVLFTKNEFNILTPIEVKYSDFGFDDFVECEYMEEYV